MKASRILGSLSTGMSLIAVSMMFDFQTVEWWGGYLLTIAILVGRVADDIDRSKDKP